MGNHRIEITLFISVLELQQEVNAYPVSSCLTKHYDLSHFVPTYPRPFHIQGIYEFSRSIYKMTKKGYKVTSYWFKDLLPCW